MALKRLMKYFFYKTDFRTSRPTPEVVHVQKAFVMMALQPTLTLDHSGGSASRRLSRVTVLYQLEGLAP